MIVVPLLACCVLGHITCNSQTTPALSRTCPTEHTDVRTRTRTCGSTLTLVKTPMARGTRYTTVIEPAWCTLSPLVLPLATAAVSRSCWTAVASVAASVDVTSRVWWALVVGYGACGTAAAVSSAVLTVHAAGKLVGAQRFDPLAPPAVARLLCAFAWLMQTPQAVVRRTCVEVWLLLWPPVCHVCRIAWATWTSSLALVLKAPLVGIPLVRSSNHRTYRPFNVCL